MTRTQHAAPPSLPPTIPSRRLDSTNEDIACTSCLATLRSCVLLVLVVCLSVGTSLVVVTRSLRTATRAAHMRTDDDVAHAKCEPCPLAMPCPECATCPAIDAPHAVAASHRPAVCWRPSHSQLDTAITPRISPVAIFVAYGNERFARSLKRVVREASRYPALFRAVRGYTVDDLEPEFRMHNAALLSQRRGGGYWVWKAHIIYRELLAARDGDVVFYMDSGSTIRSDPTPLVELAASYGALTFRIDLPQQAWTKGALFDALRMPMDIWGPQPQIASGLILLQRRPETLALAREWAELSTNATLIDDSHGGVPNHDTFSEHRHDQSIWSMLCYKYGLQLVLKGGSLRQYVHHTRVEG